jgi:hypothetical protein
MSHEPWGTASPRGDDSDTDMRPPIGSKLPDAGTTIFFLMSQFAAEYCSGGLNRDQSDARTSHTSVRARIGRATGRT